MPSASTRNGNRIYYALVKVKGKQIRRSLKTTDLVIAKRGLVEFRAKAERLGGEEKIETSASRNSQTSGSRRSSPLSSPSLTTVSGGERQRIAVARAFLRDAPILILDEPTSATDSKTEAVILDALDGVRGQAGSIIARRSLSR